MTRRTSALLRGQPWAVLVGAALTVALVSYLVGAASLRYFKIEGAASAMWWPVAGCVLVILVRLPRRWWWVLLVVFGIMTAVANLPLGGLPVTVTYAVVNVLEVGVAAGILQITATPTVRRLRTPQEAVRFVLAIAVAVALGAVLVALRSAVLAGDARWYLVTRGYVTTHVLGLFSLAPLLLPGQSWWKSGWAKNVEFGCVVLVCVAIDVWVFLAPAAGGRAFPVLLPVIWAAIRLDPVRATVISLLTCSFAAYGTSRGLGTFASVAGVPQRQLVTQLLIATVTITTLALVMITRHRAQLAAQAKDSEQTLKIAIQEALVGIYSLRLDPGHLTEIIDVNSAICLMLGYERHELVGRSGRVFDAPGDEAERAAMEGRWQQLAAGSIDAFQRETRLRTADGEERWVQLSATRVTPATAPAFALIYVHDLTGREQTKKMLESMALHDALTGLPNRSVLFPRLEELLRRAQFAGSEVGLLYLDLNGFKPVNDTYGHAAGDAVLVEVARRLQEVVRPGDTVARLGGDEFAILAGDVGGAADLAGIEERVHAVLAAPITLPDGALVTISASVGSAVGTGSGSADDLVRAADSEMYRAKRAGRDRPRSVGQGARASSA